MQKENLIQDDVNEDNAKELQFNEVWNSVQKSISERTKYDEKIIIDGMSSTNYFQSNIDSKINIDDFLVNCLKYLTAESYPLGTILLAEPDPANKLYIILKGTVRKYEKKTMEEIEHEYQNITGEVLRKPKKENSNNTYIRRQKTTLLKKSSSSTFILSEPKRIKSQRVLDTQRDKVMKNSERSTKNLNVNSSLDQDAILDTIEDEEDEKLQKLRMKLAAIKKKKAAAISDDELILNEVCNKDPALIGKFYIGGVLKYKLNRWLGPGNIVGENFMKINQQNNKYTYIVSEDVDVLALTCEDYYLIIQELMEKMEDKMCFFKKIFASYAEDYIIKLAYYFTEKVYKKNDYLYKQGDNVDSLFILRKGNVQTCYMVDDNQEQKEICSPKNPLNKYNITKIPKKNNKLIKITNFAIGQLFGDELLLKEKKRYFSALASTYDTVAYELKISTYQKIKSMFEDIFKEWADQAKFKFQWRKNRLVELLSNQMAITNQDNKTGTTNFKYNFMPSSSVDNITFSLNTTHTYKDSSSLTGRKNTTNNISHFVSGNASSASDNPINLTNIAGVSSSLNLQSLANDDHKINEKVMSVEKMNFRKILEKYKNSFSRGNYDMQIKAQENFLKKHKNELKESRLYLNTDLKDSTTITTATILTNHNNHSTNTHNINNTHNFNNANTDDEEKMISLWNHSKNSIKAENDMLKSPKNRYIKFPIIMQQQGQQQQIEDQQPQYHHHHHLPKNPTSSLSYKNLKAGNVKNIGLRLNTSSFLDNTNNKTSLISSINITSDRLSQMKKMIENIDENHNNILLTQRTESSLEPDILGNAIFHKDISMSVDKYNNNIKRISLANHHYGNKYIYANIINSINANSSNSRNNNNIGMYTRKISNVDDNDLTKDVENPNGYELLKSNSGIGNGSSGNGNTENGINGNDSDGKKVDGNGNDNMSGKASTKGDDNCQGSVSVNSGVSHVNGQKGKPITTINLAESLLNKENECFDHASPKVKQNQNEPALKMNELMNPLPHSFKIKTKKKSSENIISTRT